MNNNQIINLPWRPQMAGTSEFSYCSLTPINLGKAMQSDCAESDRPYGENVTTSSKSSKQFSNPENISHDCTDNFYANLFNLKIKMMTFPSKQ